MAEQGRIEGDRVWRAVAVATFCTLVLLTACSSDDSSSATTTTAQSGEGTGGTDGGTIDDTVPIPPDPGVVEAAITEPADFGDGIVARVAAVEDIEVDAFMPGEVSGPGVSITVELTNGTDAAVDLDSLSVELVSPGDVYATPITTREDTRLVGELAPGASGEGTYVFSIPTADRADVAVRVNYSPPEPTVIFQGDLADV